MRFSSTVHPLCATVVTLRVWPWLYLVSCQFLLRDSTCQPTGGAAWDRNGSGWSASLSFASCQRVGVCCQVPWDRAGAPVTLLRGWAAVIQDWRWQSHSQLLGLPLLPCWANLSAGQRDPVCFKRLFHTGFWLRTGNCSKNYWAKKLSGNISMKLKQCNTDLLFKVSSLCQSGSFPKAFWKKICFQTDS